MTSVPDDSERAMVALRDHYRDLADTAVQREWWRDGTYLLHLWLVERCRWTVGEVLALEPETSRLLARAWVAYQQVARAEREARVAAEAW